MTDAITNFSGNYRFLSNFWMVPIKLGNAIYKSAEHAFQAAKTTDRKMRKKIAQACTPGEAKKLGRQVRLRKDWENRKVEIMYRILQAKFSQHKDLQERLLNTGNRKLIEGNTWGDQEWGVCKGKGKNLLGKLLMKVRSEFASLT